MAADKVINAEGLHLFRDADDQVHFREPGLTHKADIYTESRAAIAGGITSFMEMPNTVPNTLTQEFWRIISDRKKDIQLRFLHGRNDNLEQVLKMIEKCMWHQGIYGFFYR
jgi:dihydroorotase